jgi:hypothetical protein
MYLRTPTNLTGRLDMNTKQVSMPVLNFRTAAAALVLLLLPGGCLLLAWALYRARFRPAMERKS